MTIPSDATAHESTLEGTHETDIADPIKGARVAITTDHPVVPINFLVHQASLAVKEGLVLPR